MIPAFRKAETPTARTLEIVRIVMLLLVMFGWLMYPVELFIIGHWLDTWESLVPFFVSVPGLIFTAWIFFDRKTTWLRLAFIITMWLSIATGLTGAYFHWVWNMMDVGGVSWDFNDAIEEFHGFRPVLAALAFTHMGVTGLACIYRAR